MNLQVLFLAALAGFALLQWRVLPQVEAAWSARTLNKLAKIASVAALKSVRTLLQVETVVYGMLLLINLASGLVWRPGFRRRASCADRLLGATQGADHRRQGERFGELRAISERTESTGFSRALGPRGHSSFAGMMQLDRSLL